MKKKIFAVICCLITIMYVFTGCSLFVENEERKLNQTVASVGDVVVTLEDLLRSYSNNAETLVSNYGYTAEQAVEYCIDSLITRGILEQVGKQMEQDGKISISDNDKNNSMSDLVTYYNNFMDAYADKAKSALNYPTGSSSSSDSSNNSSGEDYTAETKFEKTYDYSVEVTGSGADAQYKLVVKDLTKETKNEFMPAYVNIYNAYVNGEDITDSLFNVLDVTYVAEYDDLKPQIYTEIANAYKNSYTKYKNSSEKEIIISELCKVLKNYVQQNYINKVTNYYQKIAKSSPSAEDILQSYLDKYNQGVKIYGEAEDIYQKVTIGGVSQNVQIASSTTSEKIKSYISKMLEDASSIYYHPTNDCFYVSHVLLKYTDEQSNNLKVLKQQCQDEGEYELAESKELAKIRVNKYDQEGNVVKENVTPEQVLAEIQEALKDASSEREMVEIFNSFVYSYNMDTGNKNANQDYVIARAIKEDSESRSKMVTTFTDASRCMYETYLWLNSDASHTLTNIDKHDEDYVDAIPDGAYLGYKKDYDKYFDALTYAGKTALEGGKVGAIGTMTGLVKSDYGYHIIMFTGLTSDVNFEGSFDATRVKLSDVSMFSDAEWRTFTQNKTLIDLAKIKLLNMVKEVDPNTALTLDDINKVFTSNQIKLIALDGYTFNLHTDKTYFNEAFENYAGKLSPSYINGLYTDYMKKFKDTDKKFFKDKRVYEYMYK